MEDPIDSIANVFASYCRDVLRGMIDIQRIVRESPTIGEAMEILVGKKLLPSDDQEHLKIIEMDIPRLQRCLAMMEEIKALARQVFTYNVPDEEKIYVFSQEVSFSHAAKLLVSMGLRHRHYSNSPTRDEVIRAEISISLRTPIIVNGITQFTSVGNQSVEPSPFKHPATTRVKQCSVPDLTCYESMPTLKQIRPPLRHPPSTFGRR